MFVVVIIGVLAGIAIPRLVGEMKKNNDNATITTLKTVETSLDRYYLTNGSYPSNLEGLMKNVDNISSWDGPYMKTRPLDAWSQPLNYRVPPDQGFDYDLWSNGADRQSGTDDDIVSWEEI